MKLHKLSLEDIRHRDKNIYFTLDGEVLYGLDENNICYPHGFELQGRLPPITLDDIKGAFLLGVKAGRQDEKIEREAFEG